MEGTYCIYEPHNIFFFFFSLKKKKKIWATFKEYTAGEMQLETFLQLLPRRWCFHLTHVFNKRVYDGHGIECSDNGFPGGSHNIASACNAGDLGSIPGSGRSSGEGNGSPLQYSCLENPMDRESTWALIIGLIKF